jgi:O-antigen ligase
MNIIDEYEGVIRFSTTAGASTGTSIVLFMLGYILYSLTSFRYQKYILILSLLYIIFTLSRGALFAEFLLLIYLLVKKYFNFSFIGIIKLISVLISFILFFLAINYFTGIFDSLSTRLERSNKIELNEDNSRYFRWLLAYDDFNNSPLIGNGSGYMVPYNRAKYTNIESKGYYSPHNSYLMILVDYGLIGFVIFILSIYFLWLKIKNNNFMYEIKLTFYIVVFFFMNIEVVFLNVEYIVLLLILLEMDSFNIKQNCNNLIQN